MYKFEKEDENAFHIIHPDGSKFMVAKNGLNPNTMKKIQSFAEGGEVEEEPAAPGAISNSSQVPFYLAPNQTPTVPPVAPSDNAPQLPAQQTAQSPLGLPPQLQQIYSQEQSGINQEAAAKSQMSGEQAKAYQDNIEQQRKSADLFAQKRADLDKEQQELSSSYMQGKVDPNRLWNNASTGNKISAGIGIILSGLGSGLVGQGNMAMSVIQDAINKDIDSQKVDLGKKKTLLDLNMNKYKNLETAEAATRLQQMTALQSQLAMSAAKAGTPQAQAQAKILGAQLQQQMLPLANQIAQRQALMSLAGGNSQAVNMEALPEEARARAVSTPFGTKLAPTTKDAQDVKDSLTSLDALEKGAKEAVDFTKNVGGTLGLDVPGIGPVGTTNYKTGMAIRSDLVTELNKLQDLKRLSHEEVDQFKNIIPDPGAWNSNSAKILYDRLQTMIQSKKNAEYTNHLEGVNPEKDVGPMGAPKIK